jgi:crossover junction endodeoxyribonuclease RusA
VIQPDGSFRCWLAIKPKTKERPRLGRKRKAYTPAATREFEHEVGQLYLEAGGPLFEGQVEVTVELLKDGIWFTIRDATVPRPKSPTGDLDNYQKSLFDGLNKVAFNDDRQIVLVTACKGTLDQSVDIACIPPLELDMTTDTEEAA